MRRFSCPGYPYLRRTTCRTKRDLPFNRMSAAVAIALHTFHVTRAFQAWQTASNRLDQLSEAANVFLVGNKLQSSFAGCMRRSPFSREKLQNSRVAIYHESRVPTLLQQAPKKFKHSAPQKKTCLPGEGLDREKDPRSHTVGCCPNGVWFHNCSGRWRQSAMQTRSSLFDHQVSKQIPTKTGKAPRLSCPCSWFNLSHR